MTLSGIISATIVFVGMGMYMIVAVIRHIPWSEFKAELKDFWQQIKEELGLEEEKKST